MSEQLKEESAIVENGVHNYSAAEKYIMPKEPLLQERLEWFQDQKLALMIHWGLYNELGMVASWALSDGDADWSRHQVDWIKDGEAFKQQYFNLYRSFNPVRFQPKEWAALAADNGFRYLIFTTKHHDGFCMWDTKYTDYKVTAQQCPFAENANADITKQMFDAFRERGLGIAAYFSKPDWHCQYYWNDELRGEKGTVRGPSYCPKEQPKLWQKFKDYTKNQVLELCRNYGKLDILWFDGGWVCESNGQDIELGNIVDEARKLQPWLLSVDRTVGGAYENYVTPEQCIPDEPLFIPWESNLTIGNDYTYEYDDTYKSSRRLVCMLCDVVAKGGNLALNLSPQPDGRIPLAAVEIVEELGAWLRKNGEAIYGTRVCAPYKAENVAYTKKGNKVYAIACYPEEKEPVREKQPVFFKDKVSKVTLAETGEEIAFEAMEGGILLTLPAHLLNDTTPAYAFELHV